jgi:hypothetical protein
LRKSLMGTLYTVSAVGQSETHFVHKRHEDFLLNH